MRTALVTGSSGFIGRHIAGRLRADDWRVTACDIVFGRDCRALFATDTKFDLVVHCAAIVGGRATIEREPLKVATDLAIDSDFFQYVARTKPWRAVYFSSSAAYPVRYQTGECTLTALGDPQTLHESYIHLDHCDEPDAIYGWVKLTGERLARHVNAEGGKVHVFRPFSGYGVDQDLTYPFPALLTRAMNHEDPFDIWGTGEQVRDWVHVTDVVAAVMSVLEHEPKDVGPINICTGVPTPFFELADMLNSAVGHNPGYRFLRDAPTGVMYRVGDPTELHKFYTPKIDLETAIKLSLGQ